MSLQDFPRIVSQYARDITHFSFTKMITSPATPLQNAIFVCIAIVVLLVVIYGAIKLITAGSVHPKNE